MLARAGIPLAAVAPALTPVPLATQAISPPAPPAPARDVAAIAAGLLMYIALGIYGAAVANGVAQEKTSRTAEVLLATVRPAQLLAGKVIGIGAVGLGQLTSRWRRADRQRRGAQRDDPVQRLGAAAGVPRLVHRRLHAVRVRYAAGGALVARQEEVQLVTLPFGLILLRRLPARATPRSPNPTRPGCGSSRSSLR